MKHVQRYEENINSKKIKELMEKPGERDRDCWE
uniref:Uncharacterized protein n=1 Tax=Rhizophora mucronata TaxID=61149 RepID=A0A2P2KUC8_RHIMU